MPLKKALSYHCKTTNRFLGKKKTVEI